MSSPPDKQRRQRNAYAAFLRELDKQKCHLHPDDLIFEPKNFANWMQSCDTCTWASLDAKLRMLRQSLESAGCTLPMPPYVFIRNHYLKYAEDAQCRRFDVFPF
jgi:hypothetical protein